MFGIFLFCGDGVCCGFFGFVGWVFLLTMNSFLNFQFPALNSSEQLEFPKDGNVVFDGLSLSTEHMLSAAAQWNS